MKNMEELAFELDRVGAAQKCEQLMTTYVSLHMEMRHKDYLRLWTQRPDCKLEMPWGAYEGYAGVEQVRRRFSAGRGQLEDLEDEGLSAVSGPL